MNAKDLLGKKIIDKKARDLAKLAEIDDSKFGMISETSAAAIAYELNLKNNFDYDIYEHDPNQLDDKTPGPISLDEKTKFSSCDKNVPFPFLKSLDWLSVKEYILVFL